MIISRGRNYIFVHVPKTGGTAMALALEDRAKKDDILIGDTPKARKRNHRLSDLNAAGRVWKHARLSDIDGVVSPDEMDGMFIFTLVRNPWDRLVSYYHWLQVQSFDHPAVTLAQTLAFEPFLRDPATVQSLRTSKTEQYVTDITGRVRCDAFVRLEHLRPDLTPVEAHLGFRLDLKRVNRSERASDYRQYYDDSLAEFVQVLCAEDIARFGYSF